MYLNQTKNNMAYTSSMSLNSKTYFWQKVLELAKIDEL